MKQTRNRKEKMDKMKLKPQTISLVLSLVLIIIVLITTTTLSIMYPEILTYNWVIFINCGITSTAIIINLKIFVEAKIKFTQQEKKEVSKTIRIALISIWHANLVYLCIFMNWLVAFIILGAAYLIKTVYDVAYAIVNRKDVTSYPNYLIIVDSVISFLLLVYLIYKIPDESLRTIILEITAALIGGLLTLLGVTMTIRKSDRDKKDDEIRKAKPVFSYNMITEEPKFGGIIPKICFSDSIEKLHDAFDVYVEIENSNLSVFEIKRIYHDGNRVNMEGNTIVLPSSKCVVSFKFEDESLPIFLEIEDTLGKMHYYRLFVVSMLGLSSKHTDLYTVREIKSISKEAMEIIIEGYK